MSWFDALKRGVGIKPDVRARLAALAPEVDALEAELRRLGWWEAEPPPPEKMQFRQAFGIDTLAFSQWLQWVFLPAARSMLAGERSLPPSSMVGVHAVREFDGDERGEKLIRVLRRVDAAVNGEG